MDGLMLQFVTALVECVRDFRDSTGSMPQPCDTAIIHLNLQIVSIGFQFSMLCASCDRTKLKGTLAPNSMEMEKVVEKFALGLFSLAMMTF